MNKNVICDVGEPNFSIFQPLASAQLQFIAKSSLPKLFIGVTHRSLHSAPLPSKFPPPLNCFTQPKRVCVRWNLGLRTKLSWLFLLWGASPFSVATAAKYVMFSLSVPKHAPSTLIDGKIIFGGKEGWEVKHMRDRVGPWGQKVCSAGCARDEN